jgi:hypothetical protein
MATTVTRAPLPASLAWVRPLALKFVIGSLIAAAAIGVISALIGEFGDLQAKSLSTIALFVTFSLLIWYDADVSGRRANWFGFVSLGVSTYILVAGLVKIWLPASTSSDYMGSYVEFMNWLQLAFIARAALLHIHLLLEIYRKFTSKRMIALSRATFTLVALLAVLLSIPILFTGTYPDFYWRVTAAVAILDALGTVLVPLVHNLFFKHTDLPVAVPTALAAPTPVVETATPAVVAPVTRQETAHPLSELAYAPASDKPGSSRLMWPRYEDGRPLPALSDGSPDFTGVEGFTGRN